MARSVGVTRERVVAIAAELADAHGLEALTLAQVAAALKIRLPSLYNHVDGLLGLRRELALLGGRELLDRVSRAAIGKAGDDAMLALAQAYRDYIMAHPGRYAAIVRAPPADDAELQQISQSIIDVVLAVLVPYGLADDAAIHAVRGLRSIVHGFATLELAGGFGLALDRDESFLRLLRAYIAGLRAQD
ncbi:MAG: WHG domain-containing protein [Chloroflexales bacterium]|nr:WHG domain-containing protein [Chloroflexales bacterium]